MKAFIRDRARKVGFGAVGVTTAEPVDASAYLGSAIDRGRVAEMGWLARDPAARCDPRSFLPGARSVICCALAYGEVGIQEQGRGTRDEGRGTNKARFARGADYHVVVRKKLERLWGSIKAEVPDARAKLCCDTSPILEKALAQRAGLGWIGKHTVLVNRELGSWFVLGEIITDIEIEPDPPHEDLCGDCTECLDACPTKAIISPRELDARLCISYLTIEAPRLGLSEPGTRDSKTFAVILRSWSQLLSAEGSRCCQNRDSSPELVLSKAEGAQNDNTRNIHGFSYGCDLCQEACPYNIAK